MISRSRDIWDEGVTVRSLSAVDFIDRAGTPRPATRQAKNSGFCTGGDLETLALNSYLIDAKALNGLVDPAPVGDRRDCGYVAQRRM
jgi:hypothetical protein